MFEQIASCNFLLNENQKLNYERVKYHIAYLEIKVEKTLYVALNTKHNLYLTAHLQTWNNVEGNCAAVSEQHYANT